MTLRMIATALILPLLGYSMSARADEKDLASFYSKSTVIIKVGFSPGGNYDVYARVLAKHIGRHIPGNPQVIVENVPGAGSRVLTNDLYNVGPQDGTVIGLVDQGIATDQALGDSGIHFDAAKLQWIGSPNNDVNVAWTWHSSRIKTLRDAEAGPSTMGATGPSSPTYFFPRVMNMLLGTKFKIVNGYPGSNELDKAIEQGEVDGRGAVSWSALKITSDLVKAHKANILVQIGAHKARDLPNTPLLSDLGSNQRDREALEFVSMAPSMGRPFVMPPKTPKDRVEAIRKAFNATLTDREFLRDASAAHLELAPLSAEDLEAITLKTLKASPQVIDTARRAMR